MIKTLLICTIILITVNVKASVNNDSLIITSVIPIDSTYNKPIIYENKKAIKTIFIIGVAATLCALIIVIFATPNIMEPINLM